MGYINSFEGGIAREFILFGRHSGELRKFIRKPRMYSLFNGRSCGGSTYSDIYLPFDIFSENYSDFCDDDYDTVCEDFNPIRTPYNFRDGVWRGTEVLDSDQLVRFFNGDYRHKQRIARYTMEHFDFLNNNHHKENNMDRVNDSNSKSFIPLDIGKSYMNEVASYYETLFGHLPNEYYGVDFSDKNLILNFEKTMKNVESSFSKEIKHRFIYRGSPVSNGLRKANWKKTRPLEANYILDGGILIYFSEPFNAFISVYDKPEQLESIFSVISTKRIRKIPEKPRFKLLVHNSYGFDCTEFDLKHFDIDIKANYNDDLPDDKIRNFINSENEAGLCILHGKPGTGKTYYIRDLIKNCNREFIYMNKECLNYINDSSFIAFLTNNKNSVFIMEDCENVLADRTQYNNTISTLLNLSDGLLGDSLNNKFICTFNTDISNIDEALLRKGRMKVCYEFKYLSPEKANKLAEKLNKKDRFDKEVPLCDVMNSENNGNEAIPPRKKVGKIGF